MFHWNQYQVSTSTLVQPTSPYILPPIVFIPFSNEYPFESSSKDSGRCRYHISEHLSFLKRVKFRLNCLLSFIPVRASFAPCHGLRIWIGKDIFNNDGWEAWVDNCSTTIIHFSSTSIFDGNILYPIWCLMIPQNEILRIFQCASILFPMYEIYDLI
jgi:hypothetical protein